MLKLKSCCIRVHHTRQQITCLHLLRDQRRTIFFVFYFRTATLHRPAQEPRPIQPKNTDPNPSGAFSRI
ncbi:hypothetical protein BS78_02G307600 [Paspalum vaginatum]|nr:hypothetical protein BS78_02G307600 [Paspalum vaginatum]